MSSISLVGLKPVAWAGQSANITLSGISSGSDMTFSLAGSPVNLTSEPVWSDSETVSVLVPVGNVPNATIMALTIDVGKGAEYAVNVTVIPEDRTVQFIEDPLWLEMFETSGSEWNATGWSFDTLDNFLYSDGRNGKQRFSRASGQIAAAIGSGTRTLTSPKVLVPGPGHELQFASHYTTAGGTDSQLGTVSVSYDGGSSSTVLATLNATDESNLIRAPLSPPTNNSHAIFTFTFQGGGETSYWLIDDVTVVQPLGDVSGDPVETIDIISDIQGAPDWMQKSLLPGLRKLNMATTLLINGDLVEHDSDKEWNSFSNALLGSGAWDYYSSIISTAGNHEMFTSSYTSDEHIEHFVDRTMMSANFPENGNGLWGEHVTAAGTPILWLGSQYYRDTDSGNGDPPYVTIEDEQFLFLAERLAYWKSNKRQVILLAHHPLPYSVSGTWDSFDTDSYGDDDTRIRYLLAANPHAVVITSHTHYEIEAADQNVNHRPVIGYNSTVTTFNTGAVLNAYGIGGEDDYSTYVIGDSSPTGLQAEIYADRIRIKAYRFEDLSTDGTLVQTRDVGAPIGSVLPAYNNNSASLIKPTYSSASRASVNGLVLCVSLGLLAFII